MTDNRTNEPTEAQIERVRDQLEAKWPEMVCYWHPHRHDEERQHDWETIETWDIAEIALVAAQGAAPQVIVCDYCGDALPSVQSRAHIPTTPSIQRLGFSADKVVCPECVQRARGAASVLPSSGVDEDALAEVIGRDENYTREVELGGWMLDPRLAARAVAEWLKGQGVS